MILMVQESVKVKDREKLKKPPGHVRLAQAAMKRTAQ
jgi:hypothetical protein